MEMKRFEVLFSTYDETEYCTVRISSEVYAVDPKFDMFLIWDSCNKRFDWIGMDGAKLFHKEEDGDKETETKVRNRVKQMISDPVEFLMEYGYCPVCGKRKEIKTDKTETTTIRRTEWVDDMDFGDMGFEEQQESESELPVLNDECDLDDLDLTARSYNAIRRGGIETIEQLCDRTERELLKLRCLGKESLENIKCELAKIGRSLKQEGEK